MKAKSQDTIRRELSRVHKEKERARNNTALGKDGADFRALYGAEQALGWAMGGDYMAPAKCFRLPLKK